MPRSCSPRSSSCGGSRVASRVPGTPHGGARRRRAGGPHRASRPSSPSGANLGLLPLAGVPFPLVSYGGTALVVHLAAIGVVLAVRRDGARRRLWALPRVAQPAAAVGPADRVRALGAAGRPSGSTAWQVQTAQGAALQAAGHEQMTRCFRLPAARGAITDRHGAPLAANAVGRRRRRATGCCVVPALLRRRPADVDRLAALTGRPADALRAQLAAAPATTLSLPVAEVPARRRRRRSPRRGDRRRARRPRSRAGSTRRARCSARCSASPASPRPRTSSAGPGFPPGRSSGGPGWSAQYDAVLRGIDGQQCLYVDPRGRARGARTAAAIRCPAPTCGCRSTWACSSGWPPAWPTAAAPRSPGPGARSAPPSRWTRGRAQVLAIASAPVVRRQPLRAAGRRRGAQAAATGARLTDARARDPGRRAARLDVQARRRGRQPGPPGARAHTRSSRPARASPTAATPSTTGSRWAR